ncbi:hypothetical protein BJF79_09595 [Actinomadura sp. CNU-125]|nr:hypothetical protein BJF79_09595 [Actinomadura sp. CNU-125]
MFAKAGWRSGQRQLIISSIYHLPSFFTLLEGVLGGCTTVLQKSFEPRQTLAIIKHHVIEWLMTTPMHMREMLDVETDLTSSLRSLRGLLHGAGPCPAYVKRAWIDLLSPDRVFETYSATELVGSTFVDGNEWLKYPGTVGRAFYPAITIRKKDGTVCEPGEVGRVFFASTENEELTRPWLDRLASGDQSLGDLGWMNDEGYLFLAGREKDQVTVDGTIVTPAKVDSVIHGHPDVNDCLTFIVEDPAARPSLHAMVVPTPGRVISIPEFRRHCAAALAADEIPGSFSLTERIPRSDIGKIRRRITRTQLASMLADSETEERG